MIQSMSSPDIRPLQENELDAVEGGFIIGLIIGAELFAIGFGAGVVACNVANDRPWYEF